MKPVLDVQKKKDVYFFQSQSEGTPVEKPWFKA
jgi:hypothetical protein